MKENARVVRYALFAVVSLLVMGTFLPLLSTGQGHEGAIIVSVRDRVSGQPIVNATIFLDYTNHVWHTDEQGGAILTGISYGNHTLTVYKDGYKTSILHVTVEGNITYVKVALDPEPVPELGYIKGQVFLEQLIPGHTAGDAIIGFETPTHSPTGVIIDVMETSNPMVGEYIVEVAPGSYNLWCWAYSHHVEHSTPITVNAGEVTYYDFYLKYVDMSNSGLAGNITDADSDQPINNAVVIAYNSDTGDVLVTYSDTDGFYFFTGPWPGNYTVVAMAPGYNPGSGTGTVFWGEVTYVDIALKPNRTGQDVCSALWGFVFGDGVPLSSAWVFTDFGAMVHTGLYGIPGLYYISCYPVGTSTAGAWAPMYYPAFATITMPPATILRQDFYLQSGNYTGKESLVLGRVLRTGTTNPVNGATVSLSSSTTGYANTYTCSASTNLFYFALVPAGPDYTTTATKSGYVYTGFRVDGGAVHPPGSSFVMPSHTIVTLTLYMNRSVENKTCIWGYVYYGYLGGSIIPGVPVKIIIPAGGPIDVTNSAGMYYFSVTPGSYSTLPLFYIPTVVHYYDYGTSTTGSGMWSGSVSAGECRRVDFYIRYNGNPDQKLGAIEGQVIDLSTGMPVDNYEVKVYSSSTGPFTTLSGAGASGTGYFQFVGLSPTSTMWSIDGYDTTYTYTFDHLEYFIISSTGPGSVTTSTTMYNTFILQPSVITWFNIYVNKTEVHNKTVIWGYIYDSSYTPIPGTPLFIDPDSLGGDFTSADSSGMYVFYVDPGSYMVTPIMIGVGSVIYYDYGTSSSGMAPWTGTVSSGEIRQVDFIVKGYRPPQNCSAIAGIAYLNPSTPLGGVHVQVYPASDSSFSSYDFTDAFGLFNFHPICEHLDEDWVFIPHTPYYTLDRMEYHLIGSSTVLTSHSTYITFNLPSASIMWVEVYFNESQPPCNGTVFGKIYKLFSYAPAEGASVSIYSVADPTTPVGTMVTGPDGLYTFTVPAGTYIIKVNLAGYFPASATVEVHCREETYKPFYLTPWISPIPVKPILIKVVYGENNTPIKGATVIIDGVGKGSTNESGGIQFKLYSEGNYTIKVMHDAVMSTIGNLKSEVIMGPFVVFVSTESDKDEEEEEFVLEPNPDGTYHLTPGMHYKIVVLPVGGGQEKPQEKKEEEKGEYSTAAVAGVAIAALAVGGVAGFLLRGRPGEGYMGE